MKQNLHKILTVLLLVLALSAFALMVFTACSGGQSNDGPDDPTDQTDPDDPNDPDDPTPEGISAVEVGDLRIQLLSDTLVRIEEKGPKGFENRKSYIVSNRDDWDSVRYTVVDKETEKQIVTDKYTVHIPSGAEAADVFITDGSNNQLWEFDGMTDTNVYIPSPSDELRSWYFTDSPRIIPSDYGYSISDSDDPLQGWDFDNDATDVFVFLPGGSYDQFCSDYTDLTGKSEMVSLQMLGYWDSRYYEYTAETALQQIEDYLDRGYSIDVLVIDTDWREGGVNFTGGTGYEINTDLFPDMEAFLDVVHGMGVNVMFNDHPEPVDGTTNGLDKDEVEYRNENLTLILSLGVDYWWYDRNWTVALNPADPDISVYAFGMYAYNWVTSEFWEENKDEEDLQEYANRALIMANVDGCQHGIWTYASDLSAHRYSIQWTGDIGADTDALAQEIYAAVFGGAEVGLPYMSSDLGGHNQLVTDSLYSRWMQYGALSTICRVHCMKGMSGQPGRMPWLYGDTAEEVTHTYVDMRYRLLPLYYSLARNNYDTGLPIMSRLDINYPQYEESSRNDEYMLGDYVLIAPLSEATTDTPVPGSMLTHDADGGQKAAGLKAEYYDNMTWSGTPVRTQVDTNINFDWGSGAPSGLPNDQFSIKWTGYVTIGDQPASLSFFADDDIVVYIDGQKALDSNGQYDVYLTTETFAANSTHSIEVRYSEDGYNAHAYMYYVEQRAPGASVCYNSRTVFFPEGTWIDVWTGERFVGPATYTVTHPLETSPVYVREGALITLAQNMVNTSAGNWSKMALDVYPSRNFSASTTLYEDDVTTDGYQFGKYRTTEITMAFDALKNAVVVTINPAQGDFSGDRAFETRSWNVRIHTNPGWGDLGKVTLNGGLQAVAFYEQSADAKPFAFSGAALDGDLYEFQFSGSIRETYVIEIYFDNPTNSAINEEYDDSATEFSFYDEEAGTGIDLTEAGDVDWISFGDGAADEAVRKDESPELFSFPSSYDEAWVTYDAFFLKSYTNGDTISGKTTMTGIASQKDFSMTINADGKAKYYVLYVGGKQCLAKFTVRDRAGNVRTEVFGDLYDSFLRRIVIECEQEGTLYVTYSVMASESVGFAEGASSQTHAPSPSNVYFLCGFASTTLNPVSEGEDADISVTAEAPVAVSSNRSNLSDAGGFYEEATFDWMHFSGNGSAPISRINGTAINAVRFDAGRGFSDYDSLSWNDGESGTVAHTGSTEGTCTYGSITLSVNATPETKHIILYTGVWKGANTVIVRSALGNELARSETFTADNTSQRRIVAFAIDAKESGALTIEIQLSDPFDSGSNVSLAAVAVSGTYADTANTSVNASAEGVSGTVDITAGAKDWMTIGSAADMENGTYLPALGDVTYSNWKEAFDDFGATLTYGGETTAAGIRGDNISFNVNVDSTVSSIELYALADRLPVGLCIVDSEGRTLYDGIVYTASGSTDSIQISLAVEAEQSDTLRVILYKGATGSGVSVGLAAVAVK